MSLKYEPTAEPLHNVTTGLGHLVWGGRDKRVQESGVRVSGLVHRVQGFGFEVSGFRFRV